MLFGLALMACTSEQRTEVAHWLGFAGDTAVALGQPELKPMFTLLGGLITGAGGLLTGAAVHHEVHFGLTPWRRKTMAQARQAHREARRLARQQRRAASGKDPAAT